MVGGERRVIRSLVAGLAPQLRCLLEQLGMSVSHWLPESGSFGVGDHFERHQHVDDI